MALLSIPTILLVKYSALVVKKRLRMLMNVVSITSYIYLIPDIEFTPPGRVA